MHPTHRRSLARFVESNGCTQATRSVNLFFIAVCKYAGKDFSHLQRAKSTGGFFDRGVIGGRGGVGGHYSSQ